MRGIFVVPTHVYSHNLLAFKRSSHMFHLLFSEPYYHSTPIPLTARRFVRTQSSVTTQCVRCVTSAAPTGICRIAVPTPGPPTCSTIPPLSASLLLWHCGVRQAMIRVKSVSFRVGEEEIFHFLCKNYFSFPVNVSCFCNRLFLSIEF